MQTVGPLACTRCGLLHAADRPCPVQTTLPVLAAQDALPPGTVVGGRFRIEAVAHRSTMSTVYRAVDLKVTPRDVALKELCAGNLPPEQRPEVITWLVREAGLLSAIDDPRLPAFIASFSEGDRHYVAMRYVAGETLEELVARDGPCEEDMVVRWSAMLAELLQFLHRQRPPVTFRDLKPSNVLYHGGDITLLDFGVARRALDGVPGTAIGTPGYAAPEQYQGIADERSDLYALGATMHRLLTGYNPDEQAPFRHPPVAELRPDVSRSVAGLVDSLLQLAPQDRPHSAAEVAATLAGQRSRDWVRSSVCAMYGRVLVAAALAFVTGGAIYGAMYGSAGSGSMPNTFVEPDLPDNLFRVLAVFAPGVLALLPLCTPTIRDAAADSPIARRHRRTAAGIIALCWLAPLLAWLAGLFMRRWDGLTAVPGREAPACWLPLVFALLGTGAIRYAWLAARDGKPLLRWKPRHAAATISVVAIAASLSGLVIPGPPPQPALSAAQVAAPPTQGAIVPAQPDHVRALAVDAHDDLYLLGDHGLLERTPDGRFHTLLNLREPCLPDNVSDADLDLTGLVITQEGSVLLADSAQGWLYALDSPGKIRALDDGIVWPSIPTSVAIGPGDKVYVSDGSAVYEPNLNVRSRPAYQGYQPAWAFFLPASATDNTWRPSTMTDDGAGHVYVLNTSAGVQAVQRIDGNGRLTTAGVLPVSVSRGGYFPGFAVSRSGTIYVPYDEETLTLTPRGTTVLHSDLGWPLAVGTHGEIYSVGALNRLSVSAPNGSATKELAGQPLELGCTASQ